MQDVRPQPDEGYSEDVASLFEGDDYSMAVDDSSIVQQLTKALLELSVEKRLRIFKDVCPSFPTTELFQLHGYIGSLVYFDPISFLPNEMVSSIFAYLSPKDLVVASQVSRPWRERAQDERLWRTLFHREGWKVDPLKLRDVELEAAKASDVAGTKSGKRKRQFNEIEDTVAGTDLEKTSDGDESDGGQMEGVQNTESMRAAGHTLGSEEPMDPSAHGSGVSSGGPRAAIAPSPFTSAIEPKVSWLYLYKHRRRLERNWETGHYNTFCLPHPDHPGDGHTECVYTIQHAGRWLVSGSRDKTIRVWNLDTGRLRSILPGHEASVLCLQFDPTPDNDIIISGGSDTLIIVWKFTTGEKIATLPNAANGPGGHGESVLNLRFDDRYLITCSKDKTIKIWNRRELQKDDPIIPVRVVGNFENTPAQSIPPYTLLDTLYGHHAAVNAVQIHGNIIVSASGDRTIRAWDIQTGKSRKQYTGHMKGIACVQFDGRRIVSGSSDNSVRVFDYESSAEIATLNEHMNLVRTVQARFGDLDILTDEELHAQSRLVDDSYRDAVERGVQFRSGRPRNAGSTRPEDVSSLGSKMPPGGGGSRWARIVSGSYDECIIIWKRNHIGNWVPVQRLSQASAMSGANSTRAIRNAMIQPVQPVHVHPHAHQHPIAGQALPAPQPNLALNTQNLLHVAQSQLLHITHMLQQTTAQGNGQIPPNAQTNALLQVQNAAQLQLQIAASQQHQPAVNPGQGPLPAPHPINAAPQLAAPPANPAPALTAQPANGPNPAQIPAAAPAGAPAPAPGAGNGGAGQPHNPNYHHHHHHHHHHGQHGAAPGAPRDTNRVFKLQFDPRRVVTCSQNKVIVGWDFAAGDKDLERVGDWSVETL